VHTGGDECSAPLKASHADPALGVGCEACLVLVGLAQELVTESALLSEAALSCPLASANASPFVRSQNGFTIWLGIPEIAEHF
jgi:hypothetical protein